MNIQYSPGIPRSIDYPYQELEDHSLPFKCRFNRTLSVGSTKGYGRIRPLNEDLLKDVVATRPVAMAFNAAENSFLFYKLVKKLFDILMF